MRIIFVGTTGFGIPTLELLTTHYQLLAVITQPDRPVGRKKILSSSPVKVWAQKNNVAIEQPERIKELELRIKDLSPDLLLVAAYGQIIPRSILEIPKFGSVNIHASLLPKFRGATPIQEAILKGETQTGITIIKMDEKLDHGPIIAQQTLTINDSDNYSSLHDRLSQTAAKLVVNTLPDWFAQKINPTMQDEAAATYSSTGLLDYSLGRIDWTQNAEINNRKIRALNPEPGTWTTLDGINVKILESDVVPDTRVELPGKIYIDGSKMLVKCADGSLWIKKIQPEGKKPMSGTDFINGLKKSENKIFV
ncbi:MAG: methionyl-tRNA formyltransferase [Candidatus Doudnabacteria bacterium]|nr:methionyl-tRNA formyltransferase [Candidatus Doudnabacteria bacterium]